MKGIFYGWMVFQLLIGIWLFISPFLLPGAQSAYMTNNMLFGALVFIAGLGTLMFEIYHTDRLLSAGTFVYGWLAFQICIGIWLFISPYLLGYTGDLRFNDMLFGALVVVLAIGTSVFEFFHKESVRVPLEERMS